MDFYSKRANNFDKTKSIKNFETCNSKSDFNDIRTTRSTDDIKYDSFEQNKPKTAISKNSQRAFHTYRLADFKDNENLRLEKRRINTAAFVEKISETNTAEAILSRKSSFVDLVSYCRNQNKAFTGPINDSSKISVTEYENVVDSFHSLNTEPDFEKNNLKNEVIPRSLTQTKLLESESMKNIFPAIVPVYDRSKKSVTEYENIVNPLDSFNTDPVIPKSLTETKLFDSESIKNIFPAIDPINKSSKKCVTEYEKIANSLHSCNSDPDFEKTNYKNKFIPKSLTETKLFESESMKNNFSAKNSEDATKAQTIIENLDQKLVSLNSDSSYQNNDNSTENNATYDECSQESDYADECSEICSSFDLGSNLGSQYSECKISPMQKDIDFVDWSSKMNTYKDKISKKRFTSEDECIETPPDLSTDDLFSEKIPSLDLHSCGESHASKSFSGAAYANWLSAKRKLKIYEQARNKELEKERKRQIEEKKRLAEEKYKEWLLKKAQSKVKPPKEELQEFQVFQPHEDSESNRRAWEQAKLEEQRRKKEEILKAKERQKILEEKRRKQATKAWKNWLAEAPLKPKPVPLNRGFQTLKGTISDIFVNPNPWQDISTDVK